MADFSNLTYKQKNRLLAELQTSIFNHKHTPDELEKLKTHLKNRDFVFMDNYNPFDRGVSKILLENNKTK
jgi:hypothetical protein